MPWIVNLSVYRSWTRAFTSSSGRSPATVAVTLMSLEGTAPAYDLEWRRFQAELTTGFINSQAGGLPGSSRGLSSS